MPEVRPFRAIRYNLSAVRSLAEVLAPPYDIIPPADQEELLARDPHNVVRLELGELDDPAEWHARAAERLDDWLRRGFLVRDDAPAYYAYSQTFRCGSDGELTRAAVLGMVHLSDFAERQVRPHEHTLSGPKLDRLKLIRATGANISPIFGFYPASASLRQLVEAVGGQPPLAEAAGRDGIVHRLHRIAEAQQQALVQRELAAGSVYIADGHHRYETALSYQRELASATRDWDPTSPANYVMMALVAMDDPGLVILAAHRLVRFPARLTAADLTARLARDWVVEQVPAPAGELSAAVRHLTVRQPDRHQFGLYLGKGQWHTVRVSRAAGTRSPLEDLDVVALQRSILQPHLGIGAVELDSAERIAHTQDPLNAVRRVDAGEFDAAFFLRPPDITEVQAVADAGEYMPQKGTYFYPKLTTGMVLADLKTW